MIKGRIFFLKTAGILISIIFSCYGQAPQPPVVTPSPEVMDKLLHPPQNYRPTPKEDSSKEARENNIRESQKGWQDGCSAGFKDVMRDCKAMSFTELDRLEIYGKGFSNGYTAGYEEKSFNDVLYEYRNDDLTQGSIEGYKTSYAKGFEKGTKDKKEQPIKGSPSYSKSYYGGYSNGYNNGGEEAYQGTFMYLNSFNQMYGLGYIDGFKGNNKLSAEKTKKFQAAYEQGYQEGAKDKQSGKENPVSDTQLIEKSDCVGIKTKEDEILFNKKGDFILPKNSRYVLSDDGRIVFTKEGRFVASRFYAHHHGPIGYPGMNAIHVITKNGIFFLDLDKKLFHFGNIGLNSFFYCKTGYHEGLSLSNGIFGPLFSRKGEFVVFKKDHYHFSDDGNLMFKQNDDFLAAKDRRFFYTIAGNFYITSDGRFVPVITSENQKIEQESFFKSLTNKFK